MDSGWVIKRQELCSRIRCRVGVGEQARVTPGFWLSLGSRRPPLRKAGPQEELARGEYQELAREHANCEIPIR